MPLWRHVLRLKYKIGCFMSVWNIVLLLMGFESQARFYFFMSYPYTTIDHIICFILNAKKKYIQCNAKKSQAIRQQNWRCKEKITRFNVDCWNITFLLSLLTILMTLLRVEKRSHAMFAIYIFFCYTEK